MRHICILATSPIVMILIMYAKIIEAGELANMRDYHGICYKLAIGAGVKHGRLPLDKFLRMKARKVLTVDHVFEILLRITEGNTWQEAFLKVLPERKNARPIELQSEEKKLLDTSDKVDSTLIGPNTYEEEICKKEDLFDIKVESSIA